jgi:hypothetical protein
MTLHAVAVVQSRRYCRVVCFDCALEWLLFDAVDSERFAAGHRARTATAS